MGLSEGSDWSERADVYRNTGAPNSHEVGIRMMGASRVDAREVLVNSNF